MFDQQPLEGMDIPLGADPIIKLKDLPDPSTVLARPANTALRKLITTVSYNRDRIGEQVQTVYMLIDKVTLPGDEVDPMLASAYQALEKTMRLLFEAETHLLRYANNYE